MSLVTQGRSHQNLSGQVEIMIIATTYSDFQMIFSWALHAKHIVQSWRVCIYSYRYI